MKKISIIVCIFCFFNVFCPCESTNNLMSNDNLKEQLLKPIKTEEREIKRDGIRVRLKYTEYESKMIIDSNDEIYFIGNIIKVTSVNGWNGILRIIKWAMKNKGYEGPSIVWSGDMRTLFNKHNVGYHSIYNAFSELLGLDPVYYDINGEPFRAFVDRNENYIEANTGGVRGPRSSEVLFLEADEIKACYIIDKEPFGNDTLW